MKIPSIMSQIRYYSVIEITFLNTVDSFANSFAKAAFYELLKHIISSLFIHK